MAIFSAKIETNLPQELERLKRIEPRQWPFVLSLALNRSAFIGRDFLKSQIPKYIDRPVPFTLSAVRFTRATRQNVESEIFWAKGSQKVSGGQYLKGVVFGGPRQQKGFERALQRKGVIPPGYVLVPTPDVELDTNGNVPRKLINAVLRDLEAITQSETKRRYEAVLKRKGALRGIKDIIGKQKPARRRAKYFIITLNQRGGPPPGIYERRNFGALGEGKRRLFVIKRQANYTPRFPFFEIMRNKQDEAFPAELDKAIDFALTTSR